MTTWRKGFARLAAIYFAFWLLFGMYGWWRADAAYKGIAALEEQPKANAYELAFWYGESTTGSGMVQLAITFGILLPIAATFAGLIAWWIWRGFRPKPPA